MLRRALQESYGKRTSMIQQSTKLLLLSVSAILCGCKIIIEDAAYCNQSPLYSNESDSLLCIQMDNSEISVMSALIARAKTYKRPEFISYQDEYYLPGKLMIATKSSRRLSCKMGINELLCETNRVIEIDEDDENSYDTIFGMVKFYSKLRTPNAAAISCSELILNRLKKHDSAMVIVLKDLVYYDAATCITAERNSIPTINNGADTLLEGINYLRDIGHCCIPGTEPPSLDSTSSKLSQSIVEYVGRFREFNFNQSQIPTVCGDSNYDSLNNWAKKKRDYHENAWTGFIESANLMQSENPNCDAFVKKSGIAAEITRADKFIKKQKQK